MQGEGDLVVHWLYQLLASIIKRLFRTKLRGSAHAGERDLLVH